MLLFGGDAVAAGRPCRVRVRRRGVRGGGRGVVGVCGRYLLLVVGGRRRLGLARRGQLEGRLVLRGQVMMVVVCLHHSHSSIVAG